MRVRESVTSRALALGLLSLTASGLGSSATAQEVCGCNRVLPNSGSYNVLFSEKVGQPGAGTAEVEVTNVGSALGALIVARSGPATLSMSCQPDGSFTGVMQPMNQPSRIPALVAEAGNLAAAAEDSAGINGVVPIGLSISGEFDVIVNRPEIAVAANEVMEPTLNFAPKEGAGTVPPQFCARVKELIDSSEKLRIAYGNEELVQAAFDRRLAGYDESEHAWTQYSNVGSYKTKDATVSYNDLVELYALGISDLDGTEPQFDYADLHARADANNDTEPEGVEAIASIDPETCLITPPSERDSSGRCRLTIEIAAFMAHEQIHRARCLEVKQKSDGEQKAYKYWGNHPPNHAFDESEAYLETLATLYLWYDTHCGG